MNVRILREASLVGIKLAIATFLLFAIRNLAWPALQPGFFGRSDPSLWFASSVVVGLFAFTLALLTLKIRRPTK